MSLRDDFQEDDEGNVGNGPFDRSLASQGYLGQINRGFGVNSLNGVQGMMGRGNFGFAGFPPPQGDIPSHVSVASSATSVVATSGYFGTIRRSTADIDARRVICPKTARGAHGSRDYARNQAAATVALPCTFASAKHFHAKNEQGEASNKYANLQSEYAGNLAKIKTLKQHMDKWDMTGPFVIPELLDPHALSAEDRWGDRKKSGISLLKNWGSVTLHTCCAWQRDTLDYASEDDVTSTEWAKTLMTNSCDSLLVERIDEKFEDLTGYEQGGITYIKIALDEMFTISNTVVKTLQGFFEAFAKDGIAKVPNEDVRVATGEIVAVAERLAEVSSLPTECVAQILEGFTRCSVLVFKHTYQHLLTGERLLQLSTHTGRNDSGRLPDIKSLCKQGNDLFNALNTTKEWNIPQKHRLDAFYPCFNCGDPDHGVPKCPKPLDQSRIEKAKAEFSRNGGGRKGREGRGYGGRGSGGRGSGRGRGDGGKANTRGKWKGDDKASAAISGVELHNGKWTMLCKSCGRNKTHTTGFHEEWAAAPNSFRLPATHSFWTKSGRSPQAKARGGGGSGASATTVSSVGAGSTVSAGSLSARVGPLIAQYKTGSEDTQFALFLADFEKVLN